MPLYFAYGSNMDVAAMRGRCPGSRPLGRARLMRHRFVVMREGYGSVARDPRRAVWGLAWDLALCDMAALDRYESLGTGLYAKLTQPILTDFGPRSAVIYVGRAGGEGAPRPGYMEAVVAAARSAGLPAGYIAELEALAPLTTPAAKPPPRRPAWSWTP